MCVRRTEKCLSVSARLRGRWKINIITQFDRDKNLEKNNNNNNNSFAAQAAVEYVLLILLPEQRSLRHFVFDEKQRNKKTDEESRWKKYEISTERCTRYTGITGVDLAGPTRSLRFDTRVAPRHAIRCYDLHRVSFYAYVLMRVTKTRKKQIL